MKDRLNHERVQEVTFRFSIRSANLAAHFYFKYPRKRTFNKKQAGSARVRELLCRLKVSINCQERLLSKEWSQSKLVMELKIVELAGILWFIS